MTTPLPGAAAGPSIGSGMQQAASQEPSGPPPPTDGRAFTPDFFADQPTGQAPPVAPTMAPNGGRKPVQQAVEEANFFNAVQAEKKNQRIAPLMMESEEGRTALRQLVEDVNLSKSADGIGMTGPRDPGSLSPQVFSQYQQVQFDPTMQVMDPRMDKIHSDFEVLAPKVNQRKTQFSPQERKERIEAGTWQQDPKNELNYQADALQFQGRLLAGRKLKLMEQVQAGADPASLQAEAADIDAGEQYVREKLTELGQRDPRSFADKLREESQAVSDKENSAAGDAARGFVFSAAGTLRSGLAGAARLIDPGDGYTFSDKLSDWASNIDKDRAALRSKENKDSILGKLADGAGSMTAYILGGGTGTPAMVATALTTEYEGFVRQAMDQGATEDQAEAAGLAYAPISAAIELVNPQTYFANRAGMTAVRKTFIDMVKSGAKPKEALKYALDATEGGLREALEELSQTATERATNYAVNQMAGTDLNTSISAKEASETVIISTLLGGAGEVANRAATKGERSRLQAEAMMWAAKNPDQAKSIAAKVAPAEADAFGERLDKLTRTYNGNNLTEQKPKVAARVADLVHEKQDVETAIKEAPMDPSVEAAVGDPRKRKAAELTTAMIEAMGIPADKAKAALIGAGMEKAPEGTKAVTNPDGSVTLEKKPETGGAKAPTEKASAQTAKKETTSKAVESVFSADEATGEDEPTAAPTESSAVDSPVSDEAATVPADVSEMYSVDEAGWSDVDYLRNHALDDLRHDWSKDINLLAAGKEPTLQEEDVRRAARAIAAVEQRIEQLTNEDQLAPEAPAAAQAEDTGTPASVPAPEQPTAEPVANTPERHITRNKQYVVERREDGQVTVKPSPDYKARLLPPMPDVDAPKALVRLWKDQKKKVDDAERQARRTALIEYEKEYGVDTGRGRKTPIQKWNEAVADVTTRMNRMSDQNKDARLYALQFLLNGGKINFAAAKKELGSNARTDLDKLKKNGILVDDPREKSLQGVADELAQSMAEQLGTEVGDAAELRTALIDALGHGSRSGVLKAMTDILDKMPNTKDVASSDPMAAMTPEDWDNVNAVEEARNAFIEYVQKTGGDVDLANAWFDDQVGMNQRASFDHETPEQQQQLIEIAEQALSQLPPDGTETEAGATDAAPREVDAGANARGVGEGQDAEAERLAAEAKLARAERDRFVADWNERGQGLFAPEEGMAQQTIDGGFDNSQENFDARIEPLNEKVRQADKALADYVNNAASRAQAAAQQTSIPTGSAEAAARKAAAILEKAKLKPDQLYALPLPPSVWNGAIRAMQEVIIAGGKAVDAIAAAIKHIQESDWWKNKATQKEKDEVTSHLKNKQDALEAAIAAEAKAEEPPSAPKAKSELSGPKEVKKTFTTKRAYEGDFRDEVKAELAKSGLYRDIENQEEAEQRADDFIAKVGIEAALDAARAGDVRGGARAVIRIRAGEALEREAGRAGISQERIAELTKQQADLWQETSQALLEGGREASMMARMYATSDLGFNSEVKANEWRKQFGEEPSPEMMAKWKERDKEFAELKQKLADAEKRADEAQAAATMKALQDSVARQKSINRKTTPAQRSKVLADKIRTLKIGQKGVLKSSTMVPELWDAAVEVVAQTVQAGGSLATAIEAGLKKIRESDWYKKLQKDEQQDSEASFTSAVNEAMSDDVESGPIRIPKQMIREAVANGAKDIDSLVATIKEQLKDTYPDATDRQIRDAITEYGKVVNLNKDELSAEVRRIKRIGRIVSALEDVANKIRPLRSGLQRDKLDAEERALNKELREAMKDLPVDAEAQARELRTALDAAKTRARNRIEDLQREIDTRQRIPRSTTRIEPDAELQALIAEKEELEKEHDAIFGDKSLTGEERLKRVIDATRRSVEALEQKVRDKNVDPAKPQSVPETPELKALRERREKLREEYRKLQEEAGVIARRKLDASKKAAKARIQELERRIDQGDFSKKEVKPPVTDNELIRLQAEKMRLKEQYDKEFYKHKLLNRTMPERVKDAAWEFWGLTRALRATGELSFVLMQGGALTVSNLWHKPGAVARAFKTMWQAMGSEKKSEEWLRKVKAQDWYPMAKEAKLAITEPHAELSAREELFMSDWMKIIWNVLGSPLKLKSKKAYEAWTRANLFRVVERGASAYLDTLRIERFMDGVEMLEKNTGAPPSKEELKDIADVANTLTGRATIGKLEPIASTLTKLFFSPRLWASAIKTATPYAFVHFGKMTPTARKMAMQDLGRYIGTTMGLVALAATYFNNDDDDETGVETDPRSADFGKIKIGNKYIDPWGGRIQQLVFSTRMTIGLMSLIGEGLGEKPLPAYKDRKTGEVTPLGQGMTPTMVKTAIRMAQNKLAPSAGLLWEAGDTRVRKDGTRTSFGKEYDMSDELISSLYPIYWETIADLAKEDPGALEGFLAFYAFFGGGVNVDEPKVAAGRQQRVRPERPERRALPAR